MARIAVCFENTIFGGSFFTGTAAAILSAAATSSSAARRSSAITLTAGWTSFSSTCFHASAWSAAEGRRPS